MHFQIITFEFI